VSFCCHIQSLHPLKTYTLAWYEAQRKKRPRSPNDDNSANEDNAAARHQGKSEGMCIVQPASND
jgi:hypothetical protein